MGKKLSRKITKRSSRRMYKRKSKRMNKRTIRRMYKRKSKRMNKRNIKGGMFGIGKKSKKGKRDRKLLTAADISGPTEEVFISPNMASKLDTFNDIQNLANQPTNQGLVPTTYITPRREGGNNYKALYDYVPDFNEGLTIKNGDNLILLDDNGDGWSNVKIVRKP